MTYRRHFLRVYDPQTGENFHLLFVSAPEREAAKRGFESRGFYCEKVKASEFLVTLEGGF